MRIGLPLKEAMTPTPAKAAASPFAGGAGRPFVESAASAASQAPAAFAGVPSSACALQAPGRAETRLAASGEDALIVRQEMIRERLQHGERVIVDRSGAMQLPAQEPSNAIQVPEGKLAVENDDEALRLKREAIRERLRRGEKVVVDKAGAMQVPSTANSNDIQVPPGKLAVENDDEALRLKREAIRERLRRGEKVVVSKDGAMQVPSTANSQDIQVPPGKLASSFYWYENKPELLQLEKELMHRQFPQFELERQSDGRLAWVGTISPGMLLSGPRIYTIQVVYAHDHPSTSTYGGSIRVYSIDPDLEEINAELQSATDITRLPHILADEHGHIYLCTHDTGAFTRGNAFASGVSSIAWAVKWFGAFEMWLDGAISLEDFAAHVY